MPGPAGLTGLCSTKSTICFLRRGDLPPFSSSEAGRDPDRHRPSWSCRTGNLVHDRRCDRGGPITSRYVAGIRDDLGETAFFPSARSTGERRRRCCVLVGPQRTGPVPDACHSRQGRTHSPFPEIRGRRPRKVSASWFRGPQESTRERSQVPTVLPYRRRIDEETWLFHLRRGDYSRWIRDSVKDRDLAEVVRQVEERSDNDPRESRKRICDAIEAKYSLSA